MNNFAWLMIIFLRNKMFSMEFFFKILKHLSWVCATVHVRKSEDPSRDGAQVRLGSRCVYLLSHLTGPEVES